MSDAANAKLENGWGDPTWWRSPDGRIGFSMPLLRNDPSRDGVYIIRGATIYADAPNLAALKVAFQTAIVAIEAQEKKIINPNGTPL